MDINKRIKEIKEYSRLGQQEFADKAGLSKAVVSRVLNEKANAGMKVVFQVLEAFPEVNADWLIRGRGEMIVEKKQQNKQISLEKEVKNLRTRIEDLERKIK